MFPFFLDHSIVQIYTHRWSVGCTIILAAVFFPILALLAGFAGRLQLAAWAWAQAPSCLASPATVEKAIYEAEGQRNLHNRCLEINTGGIAVRVPTDCNIDICSEFAEAAILRLSQLFPGSPPLPVIELRPLYDTLGKFDNPFTLGIDPSGPEPLRTLTHELTHLYLLWALIPGLPVDCPRWLNEGLAETVSGELLGDTASWGTQAMIRSNDFLELYEVSPAFSWSKPPVEWHARTAAKMILELHGEHGLQNMIKGLRFARPFFSVYPIVSGQPLSYFETLWIDRFKRERILENLDSEKILSRLTWIAQNRQYAELQHLLANISQEIITPEKRQYLLSLSRIQEASKRFACGDYLSGLGWLRGIDRNLPEYKSLLPVLDNIQELVALQTASSAFAPLGGNKLTADYSIRAQFFAWFAALLISGVIVIAYNWLRSKLVGRLSDLWYSRNILRCLVTGVTGLAGGWFLRFLVISMIPYSGLAAIPDRERIILAETLVVLLWLAMAWQVRRWYLESSRNFAGRELHTVAATPSIKPRFSVYILVFTAGLAPPLLAAWQLGWHRMEYKGLEMMGAFLLLLAGSGAFSLAVWGNERYWSSPDDSVLPAAIIYALFRGGLAADLAGSIFALAVGRKICLMSRTCKSFWPLIIFDLLAIGPAAILTVAWFPAVDPVFGIWHGGCSPIWWWLLSAAILHFIKIPAAPKNN